MPQAHESDSPRSTFVPAGDTLEVSKDWEHAPRRLPHHSDADFKAIKHEWCRGLTYRWRWWMDCLDAGRGRDPHVIGPADASFAEAVLRFCWSPGVFRQGRRHGDFFIKSRILAFDVDDGTPHAEVRSWLADVGVTPFVSYHSPSSRADHERFRIVLLLDSYVTRAAPYSNLVSECMEHLLANRCDTGCKDAARVYFPGPEIIEANDPAHCLLGVDDLMAAIEVRVREADRHGNAARSMKDIRERCGAADGGGPGAPGASTSSGPRTRRSATEAVESMPGAEGTTLGPRHGSPPASHDPLGHRSEGFPTQDDSLESLWVGNPSSTESGGDSGTDESSTHDDSLE